MCKIGVAAACEFEINKEHKERVDSAVTELKRLNLIDVVLRQKRQAILLLQIGEIIRLLVLSRAFNDANLELIWEASVRMIEDGQC